MTVELDVADLAEVAPLLRRMVALAPRTLVRIRRTDDRLTALVRTPFDVLAARSIRLETPATPVDVTLSAEETLAWIDGEAPAPSERGAEWRGPVPPEQGWRRIDRVPDAVVRNLVRTGAMTLKEAADREGVPNAQPRAEVADVLLDSVVLTVSADDTPDTAEVTLRVLSALTRLGFLARDSHATVDRSGRWVRVAGAYGTVYRETAPSGLTVLR